MSLEKPLPGNGPGFPRIQALEAATLACLQLKHTQRVFFCGQSHRPAAISKSPTRKKVRAVPNQIRKMIQKRSYFSRRSSSRLLLHRSQLLVRIKRLRRGVIHNMLAPTILKLSRVLNANDRPREN